MFQVKLSELAQTHPFSVLVSELLPAGQVFWLGSAWMQLGLSWCVCSIPTKPLTCTAAFLASGCSSLHTGSYLVAASFIFLHLSVLNPFSQRLFAFTTPPGAFSVPFPGTVCPWQWFLPLWLCLPPSFQSTNMVLTQISHCHSLLFWGFHTVFPFPCLFCLFREGFFPCSTDEQLKEKSFACLE